MKTFVGIVVILVVLFGGWYFMRDSSPSIDTNTNTDITPVTLSLPTNLPVEGSRASASDIVVTSPGSGDKIASPLSVSGQARGSWFFEASAPVKIVDANGKILGQAPMQAQGDWMTTNMVPFAGNIAFTKPSTATGAVIFENDNPSGMASTSRYLAIPVYFK